MSAERPLRSPAERRARFGVLYERHHRSVLRYAWRRVGANEAEDLVHETFAVVWRRLDEMPESAELPWIYRIAYNLILNRARKAQGESAAVARLALPAEPDLAEAVSDRQAAMALLASLSSSERELLQLVAWEGLDARQAGAVLGCGRAAVYVRLHRLRKHVESVLDKPWSEGIPDDAGC